MTAALACIAGVLFAVGLAVADMTSPARIRGFLDLGGTWDGSLAFVMIGAIAVYAPIARLVQGRARPLLGDRFYWPADRHIDRKLVGGAALFGVGWGISGYCPGPALVAAGSGATSALVFVGAMLAGIAITRRLRRA